MNQAMLEHITAVADKLRSLNVDFAFLGGAVLGLLLTDPAAAEVRTTKDVDVLVGTRSRQSHTKLEAALREAGFQHDTSEGAPLCRWLLGATVVDILPVDTTVFGWESRWFAAALAEAQGVPAAGAHEVRVVTAPYFLATKIEAFKGRGGGDFYASVDLEDIVTVLDARAELAQEVARAPADLRAYLAQEFHRLLRTQGFRDALPGLLPMDAASQDRVPVVLERIRRITEGTAQA